MRVGPVRDAFEAAVGEVRGGEPLANLLGPGDRVLVREPRAPHGGETGTVERVRLEGGELIARVRFGDGSTETYLTEELHRTAPAPKPTRPRAAPVYPVRLPRGGRAQ